MSTAAVPRPQLLRALWTLARPSGAIWVPTLPLLGYGFAHWDRALHIRAEAPMLALFGAWILLHSGTMWLNAALDRDEGEVLFGRSTPVPPGISRFGYAALLGSVLLAAVASPWAGCCALGCAILAVLYSHPAIAWKGHPVGGPLVNGLGYGVLSPLAGYALLEFPLTGRSAVVLMLLFPAWIMGAYYAAQAFQHDEDAERGYRTLVVTHGPRLTLTAARWCLMIALVGMSVLALGGWLPRICISAVIPFVWVDRWILRWREVPGGGDGRWAAGLFRRVILGGLFLFVCVFGEYAHGSLDGGPTAGLDTVRGHPADRESIRLRALLRQERLQR